MAVPFVGTPKLSGHQLKKNEKDIRKRKKRNIRKKRKEKKKMEEIEKK